MEGAVAYLDRWSWRSWTEIQKLKAEIRAVQEMVNDLKEMVEAVRQAQHSPARKKPAARRQEGVRQKPAARKGPRAQSRKVRKDTK